MNNKITRKTAASTKSSKTAAPASQAAGASKKARPAAKKSAQPAIKPTLKPTPLAEPAAAAKPKHKLVRDSFTIPKAEYAVLDALKARAAKLTRPVKKSELLRAGISALNGMSDKAFLAAINVVPSLKTGRPSGAQAGVPPAPHTK